MSGRVAVVGGGLSGLATAWHLQRAGLRVSLFEASSRTGGRLIGETVDDYTFERNDPVVSMAEFSLQRFIDEVGLRDELLPLRPVVIAQPGRRGSLREVDPRTLSGVSRIPGVRLRQGLRLVRLPRLLSRYAAVLDPQRPELAAPLDDRSVGDFGRLYFGRSVLRHWLAPMIATRGQADAQNASRALFLLLHGQGGRARLGLPRTGLAELAHATETLLDKSAESEVRCDAEVEAVSAVGDDGYEVVTVDGGRESFDAVVLATPAGVAGKLAASVVSPAERDYLAGVRSVPGVTLGVALRRSLVPHPKLVQIPARDGRLLDAVLMEPGFAGGRAPAGGAIASVRACGAFAEVALGLPEDVVEKELLTALEEVFPGARAAVAFTHLERTAASRPRFDVGSYRALARFERVQDDVRAGGRRLFFAGDYLMAPTLDGALRSAERTAEAVSQSFDP